MFARHILCYVYIIIHFSILAKCGDKGCASCLLLIALCSMKMNAFLHIIQWQFHCDTYEWRRAFDRPVNIRPFIKTVVLFRYKVEWAKIQLFFIGSSFKWKYHWPMTAQSGPIRKCRRGIVTVLYAGMHSFSYYIEQLTINRTHIPYLHI
jgi:hypothetical protein